METSRSAKRLQRENRLDATYNTAVQQCIAEEARRCNAGLMQRVWAGVVAVSWATHPQVQETNRLGEKMMRRHAACLHRMESRQGLKII